jgi:hypothetical protein
VLSLSFEVKHTTLAAWPRGTIQHLTWRLKQVERGSLTCESIVEASDSTGKQHSILISTPLLCHLTVSVNSSIQHLPHHLHVQYRIYTTIVITRQHIQPSRISTRSVAPSHLAIAFPHTHMPTVTCQQELTPRAFRS